MRSGVIAQKVGMTRVFTEAGEHVPVTVLKLGNCQVLSHRTTEKNGYVALQLGAGTRKTVYMPKAERGQFAVAKVEPKHEQRRVRDPRDRRADAHERQKNVFREARAPHRDAERDADDRRQRETCE